MKTEENVDRRECRMQIKIGQKGDRGEERTGKILSELGAATQENRGQGRENEKKIYNQRLEYTNRGIQSRLIEIEIDKQEDNQGIKVDRHNREGGQKWMKKNQGNRKTHRCINKSIDAQGEDSQGKHRC